MLQNIRDNAQGLVAKTIIGLIVISFAFFGAESLIGGNPNEVASVNGEEISAMQLNQVMVTERNRRMQLMGDNLNPAMLEESALREPAMEQLLTQTLVLQAADEADIGVSNQAIDQTIMSLEQFKEDGQFSTSLYQRILSGSGLNPGLFKELMRRDLVIGQFSSGLSGSDFTTDKELQQVVEVVAQTRSFSYLNLPREKVEADTTVSDEEVQSYYEDNASLFKTEEQLKLEYIELKQADFFGEISEQDIKDAYAEDVAGFQAAEERRSSHILIEVNDDRNEEAAKTLAESLKQRLAEGEDFVALAEEFSDDIGSASSGGDLGFTQGETFPEAYEQALSELALNDVSGPVETDAGFHLIKLTEIKGNEVPSYEERRAAIEQRLQQSRTQTQFVAAVEELRDLVFNSEGLSGPAEELQLEVAQSAWLSRTQIVEPFNDPRIIEAAFSESVLAEGNNSEVFELAPDHFIVIHVMEHKRPELKPLAEVQAKIRGDLLASKVTETLQASAESAVMALNEGKSPAEIEEQLAAKWSQQTQLKRTAIGVNRELLSAVFAMPSKSSMPYAQTVTLTNGDVSIVQLEAIEAGKKEELSEAELSAIEAQIQRGMSAASIRNFVESLRASADIEVL